MESLGLLGGERGSGDWESDLKRAVLRNGSATNLSTGDALLPRLRTRVGHLGGASAAILLTKLHRLGASSVTVASEPQHVSGLE